MATCIITHPLFFVLRCGVTDDDQTHFALGLFGFLYSFAVLLPQLVTCVSSRFIKPDALIPWVRMSYGFHLGMVFYEIVCLLLVFVVGVRMNFKLYLFGMFFRHAFSIPFFYMFREFIITKLKELKAWYNQNKL